MVVPVRKDEEVCDQVIPVGLRNELEDVLSFVVSRCPLDIGNTLGLDHELTQEPLAANHLDRQLLGALTREMPMEILVVVEN